ncbi:MAG: hypothetical protein LBV27_02035 [Oscillospiraceae bacterium]|nr:hypothetical protein [Oscillospiraceae bacterium]
MGAICGFALVDLSSELYMPGEFRSMFQIDGVDDAGIAFTFMGREYLLGGEYLEQARVYTHRFRGLLPAPIRLARQLILKLETPPVTVQ